MLLLQQQPQLLLRRLLILPFPLRTLSPGVPKSAAERPMRVQAEGEIEGQGIPEDNFGST